MNLYKIMFEHFAPKDSKAGIVTYLQAKSDEEVYEWLKSDPVAGNEGKIITSYKYKEEDDEIYDVYDKEYNCIGQENFKERMIRLRGDMFDEDAEVEGAYYGVTLYGWECVRENIPNMLLDIMRLSGVAIEEINRS
ncbi:hypothetical protein [Paenibacillus donghaensis]|uniref:Uncharacterized protein n=1 Tax=Paenibacillus donghaensis TaxID=414771 RepID=A0A2Z2KJT1_9BACL|nr:hypothetical protein [Paenibacillus donghaensis]ASA22589.1 hypothetical protein B9T62_18455 [Paenibacillus donghaensis]